MHGQIICESVNREANRIILRSEEFSNALMPRVPKYLSSYGMDDAESTEEWFKRNGHVFPVENDGQKPGPIVRLERIPSFPKMMCESVITHYFKPEKQRKALGEMKNKACICPLSRQHIKGCGRRQMAARM